MFIPLRRHGLAAVLILIGGWSGVSAESAVDQAPAGEKPFSFDFRYYAANDPEALPDPAPLTTEKLPPAPAAASPSGQITPPPVPAAASAPAPNTPPFLQITRSKEQIEHRERNTMEELLSGRPSQRLGLKDAIGMALKNNLDVRYERAGLQIQRAQVKFAAGVFDPIFSFSAQYQDVRRPQDVNNPSSTSQILQQQALQTQLNSAALTLNAAQTQAFQTQLVLQQQQQAINQQYALLGQTPPSLPDSLTNQQVLAIQQISNPVLNNIVVLSQNSAELSTSISGRTGFGTRYAFQATMSEARNTFSGDLNPVRSIYEDSIGLQIQQPLLKGFGSAANLADLRTARISAKVQALTWKNNIATAVQGVMSAYFDMVYALDAMRVQEDAMAADGRLVQLYQRRVDLGFGSPFDVQQAAVQASIDRETLLLSKNTFLERQFALKRLILDKFEANDPRLFLPDTVTQLEVPPLDRRALLRDAFANRYDYRATLLNADVQNIRLTFAKNQLLPELDLVATYGLNGLGSSIGHGISDTFSASNPQWSVGLQFQVPFGNRQARAQYEATLAAKEQAILRIKQSELAVGVDVDTALSRIETNRQRYDAARKTRELGDEAIRIAFRRLEEGQISTYDITEQQRKLYDAKTRELAARSELSKSVTVLWLVTGTVLPRQNINFTDAPDTALPPMTEAQIPRAQPVTKRR